MALPWPFAVLMIHYIQAEFLDSDSTCHALQQQRRQQQQQQQQSSIAV
jgi:hypothetical protein